MTRLLTALAALMLLAACDIPHQPAPAGKVIPWLPLAANLTPPVIPPPAPASVPPGTQPCQATDLVGAATGGQGGTGHFFTSFVFAGTGPGACYLDGTPPVGLRDSDRNTIVIRQQAPFMPPLQPGPALVYPGPVPTPDTALKLGQAELPIDWVTQPEACIGEQPVVPAEALISIPGGGVLAVAIPPEPAAYACQGFGVGAFEGPYVPVQTSPPPPLPAIELQVPLSARIGHSLEYQVTLTNSRDQPLDLVVLCPTYEEELFADIVKGSPPLGGKHLYSLNCAPVGSLKPGAGVTFQIVFKVPADAAPGKYTLLFALGYGNAMSSALQAPVTLSK
jgi:hypothetical protein